MVRELPFVKAKQSLRKYGKVIKKREKK